MSKSALAQNKITSSLTVKHSSIPTFIISLAFFGTIYIISSAFCKRESEKQA